METNITSSSPSTSPAESCDKMIYAISRRFSCNKEMTSMDQETATQKGLRSHPQLGIAILRLLKSKVDVNNPVHRDAIYKMLNHAKVFPAQLQAELNTENMNLEDYTFLQDQSQRQAAEAKKVEDIDWGTIFTSSKEESSSKTMLDYLGLSS